MNDNLKQFLDKLANDSPLRDKLAACKSADEAFQLASSVAAGFSREEFTKTMDSINRRNTNGDLTDEDLAKVAGGDSSGPYCDTTMPIPPTASASAASAAI